MYLDASQARLKVPSFLILENFNVFGPVLFGWVSRDACSGCRTP